jgi:hypothetical protein
VCISYHRHSLRIFFQVLISSNDWKQYDT